MPGTSRTPPPFPGYLLMVGGQARKAGKSALVADIIKAFPNQHWTAVKITPYVKAGCPINGPLCGCAANDHLFAIREEDNAAGLSDSSRFLAAGAHAALWLQTKNGQLEAALPALIEELATATHVIIESDALVKFWKPSLFLMVVDPTNPDFKNSALGNLSEADAFVFRSPHAPIGTLADIAQNSQEPQFLQPLGSPIPPSLQRFLACSISPGSDISCLDTNGRISS
jgi:hypothetical protein